MEKKTIECVVTCVISNLAGACGGRSQYDWKMLGKALKGQISQGHLQGADLELVLDVVMEIEVEYWGWADMPGIQQAMIRRQIQDGIEK